MRPPVTFRWPHNEPGRMRAGMQGQTFVDVVDERNLAGSKISKVLILMHARKVSNVHLHRDTDVYVDVIEGSPRGALTLAGHDLEHVVWTGLYETLWLPPGVPHVAVYPAPLGEPTPDLLGLETRTSAVSDADIVVCPGYGDLLTRRLTELGLIDQVHPSPAMLGEETTDDPACLPAYPR